MKQFLATGELRFHPEAEYPWTIIVPVMAVENGRHVISNAEAAEARHAIAEQRKPAVTATGMHGFPAVLDNTPGGQLIASAMVPKNWREQFGGIAKLFVQLPENAIYAETERRWQDLTVYVEGEKP